MSNTYLLHAKTQCHSLKCDTSRGSLNNACSTAQGQQGIYQNKLCCIPKTTRVFSKANHQQDMDQDTPGESTKDSKLFSYSKRLESPRPST